MANSCIFIRKDLERVEFMYIQKVVEIENVCSTTMVIYGNKTRKLVDTQFDMYICDVLIDVRVYFQCEEHVKTFPQAIYPNLCLNAFKTVTFYNRIYFELCFI